MNKLCYLYGIGFVLVVLPMYCQIKMSGADKNKKRYAQPALPYGQKNQEPWYRSRGFEVSDFQEQSNFELRRQETEDMRHVIESQKLDEEHLLC